MLLPPPRGQMPTFQSSPAPEGGCNEAEADTLAWRFAKAWQSDDVQGIINLLDNPLGRFGKTGNLSDINPTLNSILARGVLSSRDVIQKQIDHFYAQTRVGSSLGDLTDALTHGRIRGAVVHSKDYYAQHPDFRGNEIVANMVEVLGSGPMGEELIRKVVPNSLEELARRLGGGP